MLPTCCPYLWMMMLMLVQLPQLPAIKTAAKGLPGNYTDFLQAFGLLERRLNEGQEMWRIREQAFWHRHAAASKQNRKLAARWTAAASHLFDSTESEMKTLMGYKPFARKPTRKPIAFLHIRALPDYVALPQDVDWRQHATTSNLVRIQGSCGSCWAVASANALEMHAELNGFATDGVAYQELVHCTPNERHCGGDGGCSGATAELAFQYAKDHGVSLYNPSNPQVWTGRSCGTQPGSKIIADGFVRLTPNLARPLLEAIATQGPVVVSADANDWETYGSGIFDGCGEDARVNHAVLAVGYGQSSSGKYFLIRNSWGPSWGEEGHIRVLRFDDGPGPSGAFCGTDVHPEEGVACEGEVKPVKVCGMCGILMDSSYPVGVRVSSAVSTGSAARKLHGTSPYA